MKRSRDEMNSPHRRATVPSHAEPSSAPPNSTVGSSAQKLTTNDALQYLKAVKDMFRDSAHKYDEFLEVMKDFKAQRIQTVGVIARVKDLFQGNRDLVLGFNNFLPKGYHITLPSEEETPPKKPVEFEEAISFVNKIKTRFQGDDRVYKAFLDILNMYRKDTKAITEVYQEVSALFSEHPDLLSEFRHFLPDSSSTAVPYPTSNKNSLLRRDGNSALLGTRPIHSEKKVVTSHADRDRSIDRPDVDIDGAHLRADKRHAEGDMERRNDRDPREQELEDRDFDQNGQRFSHKRKSSRKIEDSVGGGEHGENFGAHPGSSSYGIYSREFTFCEKVKERFSNSDGYEDFIKFLDVYNKENFSQSDFDYQVRNLFGKHQDLVEGFIYTFPCPANIDGFLAALRKKMSRPLKVEDRDRHSDRERTDRPKDLERGTERSAAFGSSNGSTQRMSLYANKDKYAAKPIQELDLSNCEQCTPSYRLLPNDYPIPQASQRTAIGDAVLNDHWVSVTSGSEDYSFKHMRKNQYEESLFRCEDDRFELDMLLELVSSTTGRVEDLLNKITDNSVEIDSNFRITDHLTVLNLRCIERIYSDHGLDVMDVLKKNVPLALPVILTRLKQKQEEWTKCRADFGKVWAEVYAKNHQKSLDHRSFYFKQNDSKSLSAKALIEEIKEFRDKKIKEDSDVVRAIVNGNRLPINPDIEFTYPDPEIHNDLYKLIEYSCGEICSSEQLNRVLNIWASFLEPMLGVPRRARAADDADDVLASNNRISGFNPSRDEDVQTEMVNHENGVGDGPDDVEAPGLGNGDETSRIGIQDISNGNLATAENASGLAAISVRQGNAGGLVGLEMRLNAEHLLSLEGGESRRLVALRNVVTAEGTVANGHAEGSVGLLRVEREEGELSPNGDFEEDNFATYGDGDVTSGQVPNGKVRLGEVGENGANDEGDGSGPRSMGESENASENGDVTGSESDNDENHEGGDHDENENEVESEGEVEGVGEAHDIEGLGKMLPFAKHHFKMAKPIRKLVNHALLQVRKKDSRIFYGNDSIYVLLRLHQVLYNRIHTVKVNVSERKWKGSDDLSPDDLYSRFLSALYNLLDGSYDNAKFEDECRAIIGTQSYILFTLDKLIFKIIKQLQAIATDEAANKLFLLYAYENSRSPEAFDDATYHVNASVVHQEENIYRIECSPSPTHMCVQLVGNVYENPEGVFLDQEFSDYIYNVYLSLTHKQKLSSPAFLKRNKRKYPGDGDFQYVAALEEVYIVNGLEIKISPAAHKYVLGTEDILYRPKNKGKTVNQNGVSHDQAKSSNKFLTRAQRFNMWLSGP